MARSGQRDRIVEAASALALGDGLDAVTVRAVATAAGVGMGTLRHYFPTQGALHAAVVQSVMDDTIQDFDIRDETADPGDRLVRCMAQFLPEEVTAHQLLEVWFAMYRQAMEPGGSGMAEAFLSAATQRSHARIASWMEQLAGEGVIAHGDVEESVLFLSALISGVCLEIITPGAAMTVVSARALLENSARRLVRRDES